MLTRYTQTSSTALLDMHTESSTLCVYTQSGIWLREIPIGGAAFTRKISRDRKLTYAMAEAGKLEYCAGRDSIALAKSVHPLLEDLGTEIARSLRFYDSLSWGPRIKKVFVAGRSSALPGLCETVSESASTEVAKLSSLGLSVPGLSDSEFADSGTLVMAALQRLGFGLYRRNFLQDSRGFGLGEPTVIACKVGNSGVQAIKVSRKA